MSDAVGGYPTVLAKLAEHWPAPAGPADLDASVVSLFSATKRHLVDDLPPLRKTRRVGNSRLFHRAIVEQWELKPPLNGTSSIGLGREEDRVSLATHTRLPITLEPTRFETLERKLCESLQRILAT